MRFGGYRCEGLLHGGFLLQSGYPQDDILLVLGHDGTVLALLPDVQDPGRSDRGQGHFGGDTRIIQSHRDIFHPMADHREHI